MIWLAVFIVVSIIDLIGEVLEQSLIKQDLITGGIMILLMPSLLGFFITAARDVRNRVVLLAIGALVFSWLGDTAGALGIVLKIFLFLVAQACYIAAFWPERERSVWRHRVPVILYGIVVAAIVVVVALGSAWLAVPVAIYGAVLALMALLATGVNRLTTVGGLLFVISDAAFAVSTFGPWHGISLAGFVVMLTYLSAQLLLACGILRQLQRVSATVG